jgi:hypothetical protein
MLAALFIFVLVGCFGLFAALRPKEYTRYFLAESQRKALSGNLKALSVTGWVIFGGCIVIAIAIPFQRKWNLLAPVLGPLFFLVCAGAYSWWGIGFLRDPGSFLRRASERWRRFPLWALRGFGFLLLLGAAGFLYEFLTRIRVLSR